MNTGRYGSVGLNDVADLEPGYARAWLSILTDFEAIKTPVVGGDPELGDVYTITETHEWLTAKEPIPILIKKDSVEVDGESVGDVGGGRMVYKVKLLVLGDGGAVEEMMDNLLNDRFILFVAQYPWNGTYIQFGDANLPCECDKESVKSGSLLGGVKGTELVARAFGKYFYGGVIPVIDSLFSFLETDDGFSLQTDSGQSILL